jgi:hypothetical protein
MLLPYLSRLQVTGGADLFIGFGGVVERTPVAAEADWYVYKYSQLIESLKRYTVGISYTLYSANPLYLYFYKPLLCGPFSVLA